jgi:hypothetical protein
MKINKEVIAGGFVGGMAMSLLELAVTVQDGEFHLVSVFFIIGCIASGSVGVIGTLMVNPSDFRNAVSAGIAAPSLLGGLIHSGVATTTTVVAMSLFAPSVHAQDIVLDSTAPATETFAIPDGLQYSSGVESLKTLQASEKPKIKKATIQQPVQQEEKAPVKSFMRAFGIR